MSTYSPDDDKLKCLRCQQIMDPLGTIPLRTGGGSGIWNFAETSEKVVHVYAYRCSNCSHVEFFDFNSEIPNKFSQE